MSTSGSLLVAVSVGPVQEFITAARRTRDFWMGSTIVSECAKVVAHRVFHRFGVDKLIFPGVADAADLEPIAFDDANSQVVVRFDIANVVLFILPAGSDARALCAELKTAAQDRWNEIATEAAERCRSELHRDWKRQLTVSPIEFYSAWAPLDPDDYARSRQSVMRLLAGRKACRDFEPWPGIPGVPKSSLDGARESVLERRNGQNDRRRQRLRVKPQEELDLVGLVKRVDWGPNAIRYPSVSRVAIDPWVRGVEKAAEAEPQIAAQWQRVKEICREIGLRERRPRNRENVENDIDKFHWLKPFPYEGVALYASRDNDLIDELIEDWRDEEGEWSVARDQARADIQTLREAVNKLRDALKQLHFASAAREPSPYLAVLIADGDAMGKTLSRLSGTPDAIDKHRQFSRLQSDFARQARDMINQRFSGVCVYSSADDVLAFVAVERCLECADALRDLFEQKVGRFGRELDAAPTLSVGLAIGHFMEPLEDLLASARHAEKRAKEPLDADKARGQTPRNALAVTVHARGGVPFTIRDNWSRADGSLPFKDRLLDWADVHRARLLPSKAAYDLRQVAAEHRGGSAEAVRDDALRVLARKRAERAGDSAKKTLRKLILPAKSADDLRAIAEELLVGQWIGEAKSEAAGERRTAEARA